MTHYYRLIIIFFFFVFFINKTFSSNLSISGLAKLNLDDIQSLTSIDLKKENFDILEINKILNDLYSSDLIFDIKLNKIKNNYELIIEENSIVNEIYINGNQFIEDDMLKLNLSSKSGKLYNKKSIIRDLNIIRELYSSIGYDNTFVDVKVEKYFQKINLIYTVNESSISKLIDVNFIGNQFFSDGYLNSNISSKRLKFYNIFSSGSNLNSSIFLSDKNKIIKLYEEKGFFDVKVSYELSKLSNNSNIINFFISEGNRTKIDKVNYTFLQKFDEDLFNKEKSNFNKKLSKNNFFYDSELINDHLDNFNEILISNNLLDRAFSYDFYSDGNSNVFNILETKISPKIIKNVNIEGNSITKDKTIRSKLDFQPGDYLNNYKVEKGRNDLSKLKYINRAEIFTNVDDEKNVDLTISLDENTKTGNFLLGGSFSGDTGFGLGLGLKDSNILGTGNEVDFSFDINAEKTLFKINYSKYSLINSNIIHNYSISNQETDLTSSFGYKTKNQSLSYGVNYGINKNLSFSSGIEIENKIGHSQTNNYSYITENIDTFNQFLINFSINQNDTNDILYPTNGFQNKLTLNLSPENLSDDAYFKIIYRNKIFHEFKNSQKFIFIDNNLGLAESFNGNLKTINAFSLGGLNFKGFDYRGIGPIENNIYLGGNKFFTSSIGYGSSFIFDEKDNINIKVFATTGSIWDGDYSNDSNFDLRSSLGASFDVLTAVGPISFSYAIPINKKNNDKVREFNFSIGTSF